MEARRGTEGPGCTLLLDRLGTILAASGHCTQMFGRPSGALIGSPMTRFVERESVRSFLLFLWTCRDTGVLTPYRLRGDRGRCGEMLLFGRARTREEGEGFELTALPLDGGLEESLQGVLGVSATRVTVDDLPVGLLIANPRRILTRVNRAAAELFRLPEVPGPGQSLARLFPTLSWSQPPTATWSTASAQDWNGQSLAVEYLAQNVRDGVRVWVRDLSEAHRTRSIVLELSEQERRRIGRELHDSLGQHLTGLTMLAGTLAENAHQTDSELAQAARRVANLARDVVKYTRNLSRGLFPPDLEDRNLGAALQDFAAATRDTHGVECEVVLHSGEHTRLGDALATTHLYRIAQEAITNAIRHGKAGRITVDLELQGSDGFRLEIRDDGQGFPPGRRHAGTGLRSMRHRAELLGAALEILPESPRGVTVRCWRTPPRISAAIATVQSAGP